jgi:hypothetical protein
MFPTPGTKVHARIKKAVAAVTTGRLISITYPAATGTITIPASATQARVRLWGGSGGSGGVAVGTTAAASGGVGCPGYLEKYLTGLTPGNTLTLTLGTAGAAGGSTGTAGGNGAASTLASGTQTITTLTASGTNGSAGVNSPSVSGAGTAGATATNGDINISGNSGQAGIIDITDSLAVGGMGGSGGGGFTWGPNGVVSGAGQVGRAGGCIIEWFA